MLNKMLFGRRLAIIVLKRFCLIIVFIQEQCTILVYDMN